MAKVYVREDRGRRFLDHIECDAPECSAVIRPNPEIATSGWVVYSPGNGVEYTYCPDHTYLIPESVLESRAKLLKNTRRNE